MGRYSGKTCRLLFMLVLTVAFFVAELVSGYLGNSIALLSDSFNMLSDLISLCVGLSAGYIARRPRGGLSATYGYARAEVVGALSNAVFLTALCFTIFVEAVLRLARPERIDDPELVLIVGALGLAVNLVGLLIFQDCAAWFACCGRRRRRQQQRHQQPAAGGGPRGVFPGPQGAEGRWHAAALPAPGRDSAVTLRVASVDEKGATVFSNVAGAFRLHLLDRVALPSPARPVPSSSSHALFLPVCFKKNKTKKQKNPQLFPLPAGFKSVPLTERIPPFLFFFLLGPRALFASFPLPLFSLYRSIDPLGNQLLLLGNR